MFYFSEALSRILFSLYSFFFTAGVCFFFKEEFLFLCILPTLKGALPLEYFIFTNPSEIFYFILSLVFFISLVLNFPFFIWLCVDFLKSGFYRGEWRAINQFFYWFLLTVFFSNLFFYFFLIPWVWHFFLSFSKKNETLVFFFMEPKAFEYFVFFFNFLFFFNCVCFLSFALFYYFFHFRKISLLLKYKSWCYLCFLLVATLLTPPDFFSQLIMFGGLALIFEVSLCFYVLIFFYTKIIYVSQNFNKVV